MAAAIKVPADLERVALASGQAALWWLGQAGFAVRAGGTTLLLDPFLARRPDRLSPPPFSPEQATGIGAILCSHEHIDHFDAESLPGLAAASPEAKVVVPTPLVPRVTALGILPDRVIGAQPDEPFELDGVTIHPVPALHGVDVADAYTFGRELSDGLYRYLGYVVEAGGLRVYHAGDTLADEELEDRLTRLAPDVALLPINGRDHYREAQNLVGNMDHREAVSLAASVGAGLLVPMHYDMFASNLGYPAHAVDFASRQHQDVAIMVPSRQRPFVCAAEWGTRGRGYLARTSAGAARPARPGTGLARPGVLRRWRRARATMTVATSAPAEPAATIASRGSVTSARRRSTAASARSSVPAMGSASRAAMAASACTTLP